MHLYGAAGEAVIIENLVSYLIVSICAQEFQNNSGNDEYCTQLAVTTD